MFYKAAEYNLLVVESPSKAITIKNYLESSTNENWEVLATRGHLQNLPEKKHGISKENDVFVCEWEYTEGKKKLANSILKSAKSAKKIYIATDGDLEGERIAHDLAFVVGLSKLNKPCYRAIFREITKKHIIEKINEAPNNKISESAVNAQMARRMIYREVGYPVSYMLRKDFERRYEKELPNGTGNVIAPALSILVEAEKKIEAYIEESYEKVYADYVIDGLQMRLVNQAKYKEEHNIELEEILHVIRNSSHIVKFYEEKEHEKSPPKPLTTSTLQRGSWYLYAIDEPTTMKLAQRLYDGVLIDGERIGLVTYMRTDSINISDEAARNAIEIVNEMFGEDYTLHTKRTYKNKKDKDKESPHEAIRPTQFDERYWPNNIKESLYQLEDGEELFKIYSFIYKRFLCIQMTNARYDFSKIEVSAGGNILIAQANSMLFDGWEKIGSEVMSNYKEEKGYEREVILPQVNEGDELNYIDVSTMVLYTRSPDRYGRGRFITTLETKGIGKPSTLSTVVPSLLDKKYITLIDKQRMLQPTPLGRKVHEWHREHCPWLINLETAKELEDYLTKIENDEMAHDELVNIFHESVEQLKIALGFNPNSASQGQIDLAKRIAKQMGQYLDDDFFNNKEKVKKYIDANKDKLETLCECLFCKKGSIYEADTRFACNSAKCGFVLWKNKISGFFTNFKVPINEEDYANLVKMIFLNKSVLVNDMIGKKDKPFNAVIGIEYNNKYKNYEIKILEFIKDNLFKSVSTSSPELIIKENQEEINELKEVNRRLEDKAYKDQLSRALNRTCFNKDQESFSKSNSERYVAFLDGDDFKTYNDRFGHKGGDDAICHIANSLFKFQRNLDVMNSFYRWGGEEFVMLFEGKSKKEVAGFLENFRIYLEQTIFDCNGTPQTITVSIGYTQFITGEDMKLPIDRADSGTYKAKENGKNRIEFISKEIELKEEDIEEAEELFGSANNIQNVKQQKDEAWFN